MAHIFISYSSKHRDLTEELAAFLEGCGLDVWWDRELVSRSPFDGQIQEQLRTAGCIVVIWTEGAIASEWVHIEARHAIAHDRLVAVRADDFSPASIPEEFRKHDAHKLVAERDLLLKDVLAVREGRLLLEDKREELPAPNQRTPTMLLQAKFGLVPFTGSDAVRDDLVDWVLSRGTHATVTRRAAGRLVHGPGGLGKTRLLIEVAERVRAEGWSAGFLTRPGAIDQAGDNAETRTARRERQVKALNHLIRGASDKGLLLVMDYAEGRELEIKGLSAAIQTRPMHDTRPIRLVLLTRGAGDWWTRLIENDQVTQALFGGEMPDARALKGITNSKDRLDLFLAAVHAFIPRLVEMGYAMPTDDEPTRQLEKRLETVETNTGYKSGEGYDRPLAIAMEALLYLAARAPGANAPGVHNLLGNILGLERDHWPKLVPLRDEKGELIEAKLIELERAVGQVTAVQGVDDRRAAEALFMADRFYAGDRTNRGKVAEVTANAAKLYGRGAQIAQFEPDLIGEHHVASERVGDPELLDGCIAWIASQPDESKRSEYRADLVTVLQRASRPEHGAEGVQRACNLLDHLIANYCAAMVTAIVTAITNTPGALFDQLNARIDQLPEQAISALHFAIPPGHVTFLALSCHIAQRHSDFAKLSVEAAQKSNLPDHELELVILSAARAYNALGGRLTDMRRHGEASAASDESLKYYTELNRYSEGRYAKEWHGAVHDKVVDLMNLGRIAEARDLSELALKIVLELSEREPDEGLPPGAKTFSIIAQLLRRQNRLGEAKQAGEKGVDLYKILRAKYPGVYDLKIALALSNLAAIYADMKYFKAAGDFASTAVSILRHFDEISPDTVRPDLATALLMHGAGLFRGGNILEAHTVITEAVMLFRQLASINQATFSAQLAEALRASAPILSKLGRFEDALAATEEANRIGSSGATPVESVPGSIELDYSNFASGELDERGTQLHNLGVDYSNLKKAEQAVAASEAATSIYRYLMNKDSDTFSGPYSMAISSHGVNLSKVGRHDEAIASVREAVEIRRRLANKEPHEYLPRLATSILALTDVLIRAEHLDTAKSVARYGVDTILPLAEANPSAFALLVVQLWNQHETANRMPNTEEEMFLVRRISHVMQSMSKRE